MSFFQNNISVFQNNILIPDEHTGYDTYITPINQSTAIKFGLQHKDIPIKSQLIKISNNEAYVQSITSVVSPLKSSLLRNGYHTPSPFEHRKSDAFAGLHGADELIFHTETPHQVIITHYQTTDVQHTQAQDIDNAVNYDSINKIPIFIHHFYAQSHCLYMEILHGIIASIFGMDIDRALLKYIAEYTFVDNECMFYDCWYLKRNIDPKWNALLLNPSYKSLGMRKWVTVNESSTGLYATDDSYLLSPTFHIHQFQDLKHLNLYICKQLRTLEKDSNHPCALTAKRRLYPKWEVKIDKIVSCVVGTKDSNLMMVKCILYFAVSHRNLYSNIVRATQTQKHLLGITKQTIKCAKTPATDVSNTVSHLFHQSNEELPASLPLTPLNPIRSDSAQFNYETMTDDIDTKRSTHSIAYNHEHSIIDNIMNHKMDSGHKRYAFVDVKDTLLYKYRKLVTFLSIYSLFLVFFIVQRLYFAVSPVYQSQYLMGITGRIMLVSLCLLFVCRMISFKQFLFRFLPHRLRSVCLEHFLNAEYAHLVITYFGIILPLLVHILCAIIVYSDMLSAFDIVRICVSLLAIALLILSNYGSQYYSKYHISLGEMAAVNSVEKTEKCNKLKSVFCNPTFDIGHDINRNFKKYHILSSVVLVLMFYLDLTHALCIWGIYYVFSFVLFLFAIDRVYYLFFSRKICEIDPVHGINMINIDHEFEVLYIKHESFALLDSAKLNEIFYMSQHKFSVGRVLVFFKKLNEEHCIGFVIRKHRKHTIMWKMERVLWSNGIFEDILDSFRYPIFRGPFRSEKLNVYQRLLLSNKDINKQYLIGIDEGVSVLIKYLTRIQNLHSVLYPTHIIFATSSTALLHYVSTSLQLLFIEIKDLTIECKLLPSNINLIPDLSEMIKYYKRGNDTLSSADILNKIENDLLNYLSIPHILTENENKIEMYYAGVPLASNALQCVCEQHRIPFFTQPIY